MIEAYRKLTRPLVVGLMSGTSADAIDALLVRLGEDPKLEVLGWHSQPIPPDVREQLFACFEDRASVREAARLNFRMGELFAQAALTVLQGERADLVASHGQTIVHLPVETTMQIGEPAVIAARTQCLTVADFRVADLAEGGQAAPLVPVFDGWLLRRPDVDRLALNFGGIANLSWIPRDGPILGWDTGPANVLLDALAEIYVQQPCDRDGALAARGNCLPVLLAELLQHPYFRASRPKSTGREDFGREMARSIAPRGAPEDVMRTAVVLSAESLAREVAGLVSGPFETVVGGGGLRNPVLMNEVTVRLERLGQTRLRPFDDFGVGSDQRETAAFAVLGHLCLHGRPAGLPSVTGARRAAVLGKICLPP